MRTVDSWICNVGTRYLVVVCLVCASGRSPHRVQSEQLLRYCENLEQLDDDANYYYGGMVWVCWGVRCCDLVCADAGRGRDGPGRDGCVMRWKGEETWCRSDKGLL